MKYTPWGPDPEGRGLVVRESSYKTKSPLGMIGVVETHKVGGWVMLGAVAIVGAHRVGARWGAAQERRPHPGMQYLATCHATCLGVSQAHARVLAGTQTDR